MTEPLDYPWEATASGGWQSVAAGVHWLRLPLPFALDHINLWLLEDGDGWTVVDTGLATEDCRQVWQRVFDELLGGRPLRRIIVTHFHPDHYGLAFWLQQRTGASMRITADEQATAWHMYGRSDEAAAEAVRSLYASHGLSADDERTLGAQGNRYRRVISGMANPGPPLADGERLRIGDRDWQIIVGRGHTPEHACLYSANEQLLIAGDQVLPRISSNISVQPQDPEGDPLRHYLESLDRLAELPTETLVLPSHGLAFRGLRTRIKALHEHHAERLAALADHARRPTTAAEALPVLFHRELDEHTLFFAMGEAIAHLNHLWHDGRLTREQDATGVYRFAAASP